MISTECTMKINQDTFKNDTLHFGANNSNQRDSLYEWRWSVFVDVFETDFPEYAFRMIGLARRDRTTLLYRIQRLFDFKFKGKLVNGLTYSNLESTNTVEFDKTITKFRNHLNHPEPKEKVKLLFAPLSEVLTQ